jgi:hypothetical protein
MTLQQQEPPDGAIEQLKRIAKAFGYDRIWPKPSDDSVWFAERAGKPGFIEAVPLDHLIQDAIKQRDSVGGN